MPRGRALPMDIHRDGFRQPRVRHALDAMRRQTNTSRRLRAAAEVEGHVIVGSEGLSSLVTTSPPQFGGAMWVAWRRAAPP